MNDPVLAIDIGGTKILVALAQGGAVLDRLVLPTPRGASAEQWCDAVSDAVAPWKGRYAHAGAAVTGAIRQGRWYAVNPETLPVPAGFDLSGQLARRLGVPVHCANDAHAAAWGEYRHGAGQGRDLAFVTISTGIGGGLVIGGKLVEGLSGLAGHVGLLPTPAETGPTPIENLTSGRWLAAAAVGRAGDARGVFAAADAGAGWARELIEQSLDRAASVLQTLQWIVDPEVIVIGGGIGLAPRYFAGLGARLDTVHATRLVPARLGGDAGIIGAADLAVTLGAGWRAG